MKLTIQSIHFDAADHLKAYIQKKCNKLDQLFDRIVDAEVILKLQQSVKEANKVTEIYLRVPGDTLVAKEQGKTFEAATDLATDKIKEQLRRYKGRIRERGRLRPEGA